MDRWEKIRIGGGIAAALAVAVGLDQFSWLIFPTNDPARAAYRIPDYEQPGVDLASLQRDWPRGAAEAGGFNRLRAYMGNIRGAVVPASLASNGPVAAAPQPVADIGTRLAAADRARGQKTAQVCTSCHSFEQGGPNRTGPDLWGVVGRPVGKHGGFNYSTALATHGGEWTYEELDKYLSSPARAIPGNKMGFAGIRNPADRANVLAFLGNLGGSLPYPKPAAQ